MGLRALVDARYFATYRVTHRLTNWASVSNEARADQVEDRLGSTTRYGVHTGLQNTSVGELIDLWRRIERLGFDWISIWDHFYGASLVGDPDCFEAIAMHAALACNTEHVRCGSLVYSIGYRHPAVLANAITAIDHLSGGRAEIGLGAGWSQIEYDAYGIPFPRLGDRMDQLEEGIQCVRGLLHNDKTDFAGLWFTLNAAQNQPLPIQAALPIWIGGLGETRTLRIAAKYADGWNGAGIDPGTFSKKCGVLNNHCEDLGRDPSDIRRATNLIVALDDCGLARYGGLAESLEPGALYGSDEQIKDRIAAYIDAGADQINFSVRAPYEGVADQICRLANILGLSPRNALTQVPHA